MRRPRRDGIAGTVDPGPLREVAEEAEVGEDVKPTIET
jgi:hypothetical protein